MGPFSIRPQQLLWWDKEGRLPTPTGVVELGGGAHVIFLNDSGCPFLSEGFAQKTVVTPKFI